MIRITISLAVLLGAGCSKGEDPRKAAYANAAAQINPVVNELKGVSAKIMTVPEKADLSTFPTLAQHCVDAKPIVGKLASLVGDKEAGPSLVGTMARSFVQHVDDACKDITYAEAINCWKPCATAWKKFEDSIVQFRDDAKIEKVDAAILE